MPWLRVVLPHFLTAAIAIAVSLALQAMVLAPPRVPTPAATPVATPAAAPTSAPTSVPTPAPPLAPGIARQELEDVRAEFARVWMTNYLYLAVIQLNDAEALLRTNDRPKADQALLAVDASLAMASEQADDALQDPINELRRDVDRMRGDLFLRPEGMDARLGVLRQTILTLVGAPQ